MLSHGGLYSQALLCTATGTQRIVMCPGAASFGVSVHAAKASPLQYSRRPVILQTRLPHPVVTSRGNTKANSKHLDDANLHGCHDGLQLSQQLNDVAHATVAAQQHRDVQEQISNVQHKKQEAQRD